MGNVITLNNIEKTYFTKSSQTQALKGVSLSFTEGSFTSIIGQSGSGKSTLLNIIGTLDQPTKGELLFDETKTTDMNLEQLSSLRNELIGFIFQFHYLLPEFTVLENILMPSYIRKTVTKETIKRAEDLVNLVGISNEKNKLATDISGGQQQRAAIARALINDPKVILADEPTGNLDSDLSKKIYELFRKINQETNTTFIIITHDERIAEKGDRTIEIKDGIIASDK
jgi:lipoprotein-releasing system ATP-binding protein